MSRAVSPSNAPRPRRVAYVMSRFPKLTETFVLDEILGLEREGVAVEVFPLWREKASVVHPEAKAVVDRAHFLPTLDLEILRDNVATLLAAPVRYLGTLGALVRANRRSARFLLAALAIFPKSVSFAKRMRALGVEHVHAHFASHPAAAAFVVGRISDLPWSFTAHGSDLHREQSMLAEKVREARFVVAISDYNRRFILDHTSPSFADRVEVVHCGVDPSDYAPRQSGLGSGLPLQIVCVGTLHAVKGQRVLIEACAKLPNIGSGWRLHLVGEGEDRAALERRVKELDVTRHVVFHGACTREQVRAIFADADVAVAPSVPTADGRREGIPVVLMEAAATGLPLVGSRLSGIPEIIREGETGLLIEPGDADALAKLLLRLARDPEERARLGKAARALVERDFALDRNLSRLRSLFFDRDRDRDRDRDGGHDRTASEGDLLGSPSR